MNAYHSWSEEQKAFAVKTYYETKSFKRTRLSFVKKFNLSCVREAPSKQSIYGWVKQFESTGHVLKQCSSKVPSQNGQNSGRKRLRTPEKIEQIRADCQRSPKKGVRKRAQQNGLTATTTWRILRKDIPDMLYFYHCYS